MNRPARLSAPSSALTDLADVIGWESVGALVRTFAGQRISIPKSVDDGHILSSVLGREKADLLCRHYQGDTIYLPNAAAREAEVLRLAALKPALTINEIAARTWLSYRGVQKIIARHTAAESGEPASPTLFDHL